MFLTNENDSRDMFPNDELQDARSDRKRSSVQHWIHLYGTPKHCENNALEQLE